MPGAENKADRLKDQVCCWILDVFGLASAYVVNGSCGDADGLWKIPCLNDFQVNDYFSRIEDEVHRSSFDARSRPGSFGAWSAWAFGAS